MLIAHGRSFTIVMLISLAFVLLGWAGIEAFPGIELGLFALVMLVTGIPHGATDHLIYSELQKSNGHQMNWRAFLGFYLLTMAAYSLVWLLLPGISLLIFLIISAYHFGQSQVLYIRWNNVSLKKRLLNLSWGTFILSALLITHLSEVLALLSSIIAIPSILGQLNSLSLWGIVAIPAAATLLLWGLAIKEKVMTATELLREFLAIAMLLLVFNIAGLWMGFALYFGVWHAGSSMAAEIRQFQRNRAYSWQAFFRDALPFSLISLLGIGILGLLGWWAGDLVPLVLLFFIAISVLTLPHTIYMDRFYRSHPPHENLSVSKAI